MLIVFLFLVLIFPYGSQSSQISSENFILEFLKSKFKRPFLRMGSYKISPVCLSICPSDRPSVTHFTQDLQVRFS